MKLTRFFAASIVGISLLSASTSALACEHDEEKSCSVFGLFCHHGDHDQDKDKDKGKGQDQGKGGCSGGGKSSGSGSSGSGSSGSGSSGSGSSGSGSSGTSPKEPNY